MLCKRYSQNHGNQMKSEHHAWDSEIRNWAFIRVLCKLSDILLRSFKTTNSAKKAFRFFPFPRWGQASYPLLWLVVHCGTRPYEVDSVGFYYLPATFDRCSLIVWPLSIVRIAPPKLLVFRRSFPRLICQWETSSKCCTAMANEQSAGCLEAASRTCWAGFCRSCECTDTIWYIQQWLNMQCMEGGRERERERERKKKKRLYVTLSIEPSNRYISKCLCRTGASEPGGLCWRCKIACTPKQRQKLLPPQLI